MDINNRNHDEKIDNNIKTNDDNIETNNDNNEPNESPEQQALLPLPNNQTEMIEQYMMRIPLFASFSEGLRSSILSLALDFSSLHLLARARSISPMMSLFHEANIIINNPRLLSPSESAYSPSYHQIMRAKQAWAQCSDESFDFDCSRYLANFGFDDTPTSNFRRHRGHRTVQTCPVPNCGRVLQGLSLLNGHLDHHGYEVRMQAYRAGNNIQNNKDVFCWICNEKLEVIQCLTMHLRTHRGLVRFKCELCHKVYNTPEGQCLHLALVHANSPWCYFCSKQFACHADLCEHFHLKHASLGDPLQVLQINLHCMNINTFTFRMRQLAEANKVISWMQEAFMLEHYVRDEPRVSRNSTRNQLPARQLSNEAIINTSNNDEEVTSLAEMNIPQQPMIDQALVNAPSTSSQPQVDPNSMPNRRSSRRLRVLRSSDNQSAVKRQRRE